jgi:hypothetical protein
MTTQTEVKQLARQIAKEIRSAKAGVHTMEGRLYLEANPETVIPVLTLLQLEASRTKPNQSLVQGYLYLLATALELLRYQIERGYDWAEDLIAEVKDLVLALVNEGKISGSLLTRILNTFREVRLDVGEELTSTLGELTKEEGIETPNLDPAELDDLFADMVQAFGENEFDLYEGMAEFSLPMPPEFREVMTAVLVSSPLEALRNTATLSLLDPSPEVRRSTCQALAGIASPSTLSPVSFRRMIAVRNWLPEGERHHLDSAIRRARRNGVECAPWPSNAKADIYASAVDGAGAQSVVAITKNGRKHRILNLLVKQDIGVADTWCLRDQSKTDVASFMTNIRSSIFVLSVVPDLVETIVRHNLAVGAANESTPPVEMIDFVESLGLANTQPRLMTVEDLLALMEPDVKPALLEPEAVEDSLRVSGNWPYILPFGESWFEDDPDVRALLNKNRRRKRSAQINLIIDEILESRRTKWAERFSWMALWAKHESQRRGPWHEFLLLAREIQRGRPLRSIPIMRVIGQQTLEAAT